MSDHSIFRHRLALLSYESYHIFQHILIESVTGGSMTLAYIPLFVLACAVFSLYHHKIWAFLAESAYLSPSVSLPKLLYKGLGNHPKQILHP
jgi:hypothetical protein